MCVRIHYRDQIQVTWNYFISNISANKLDIFVSLYFTSILGLNEESKIATRASSRTGNTVNCNLYPVSLETYHEQEILRVLLIFKDLFYKVTCFRN